MNAVWDLPALGDRHVLIEINPHERLTRACVISHAKCIHSIEFWAEQSL
jgi:hypothetical protein